MVRAPRLRLSDRALDAGRPPSGIGVTSGRDDEASGGAAAALMLASIAGRELSFAAGSWSLALSMRFAATPPPTTTNSRAAPAQSRRRREGGAGTE